MILCGRENEIRQIAEECKAGRLAVMMHEPGLGATALLEAGVLPALMRAGFIALTWRDWQGRQFVTDLKEAIAEAVRAQADDSFFAQTESLEEMVLRIHQRTGRDVALLFDQFEDYLRCHAGTDLSDRFDAELAGALAGHRCGVAVAMQEHAAKEFERFGQHIPNLFGCRLQLGPLSKDAARDAVAAEAERRGIDLEPGVVERLVSCATVTVRARGAGQPGVHPFFLMRGVNRLFDAESRLKSSLARTSTLDGNGGPDRLILESLDATAMDLNHSHLELFFRWCNILISPAKQRLSVSGQALTEYAGKLNRFVLTGLPLLQELGLLRAVEMQDVTRYEIARECYTPILRDWWERREAELIAKRRARFRVRSLSVAAGSIVAIYAVWLLMTLKGH